MNLKKKTIQKEERTEEALRIMKIRYEKKNPCSYLLYLPYGRVMLYTGRKGMKINAVDKLATSKQNIYDLISKIKNCLDFLTKI